MHVFFWIDPDGVIRSFDKHRPAWDKDHFLRKTYDIPDAYPQDTGPLTDPKTDEEVNEEDPLDPPYELVDAPSDEEILHGGNPNLQGIVPQSHPPEGLTKSQRREWYRNRQ